MEFSPTMKKALAEGYEISFAKPPFLNTLNVRVARGKLAHSMIIDVAIPRRSEVDNEDYEIDRAIRAGMWAISEREHERKGVNK